MPDRKSHPSPSWVRPARLIGPSKAPAALHLGIVKTEAGPLHIGCAEDGAIYWASFRRSAIDAGSLASISVRGAQSLVNEVWASPNLRLAPLGTDFQRAVWAALLDIPAGGTSTYADIAQAIGHARHSARAVGGAVGANPIVPFIPCHRVVAAGGLIGGYSGGSLAFKRRLLDLEGADIGRAAKAAA